MKLKNKSQVKNSEQPPHIKILVGRISTIGGTEVGSTVIPAMCKYSCKESTTPEVGFQYKSPEPTFSHPDLRVSKSIAFRLFHSLSGEFSFKEDHESSFGLSTFIFKITHSWPVCPRDGRISQWSALPMW